MSAHPQRRGFLGLLAATPLAAAAGVRPASILGRAGTMSLSVRAEDGVSVALGRLAERSRDETLVPTTEDLSKLALDIRPRAVPNPGLGRWAPPSTRTASPSAEARAIAALALVYPPEIAAYRSFGAPMRRRLYAELLTREFERLAALSEPPPTPPASPGPDA